MSFPLITYLCGSNWGSIQSILEHKLSLRDTRICQKKGRSCMCSRALMLNSSTIQEQRRAQTTHPVVQHTCYLKGTAPDT